MEFFLNGGDVLSLPKLKLLMNPLLKGNFNMKMNFKIGRYVILGLFFVTFSGYNIAIAQPSDGNFQSDKIQTASETSEPKDDTDKLQRFIYEGRIGFLDKNGEVVIPAKYNFAESFHEGLASVKLNGKYGFIDKTGKEIIPPKYDDAGSFNEGLASVKLNGK
jgi:hypothetical protein